MKFTRDKRFWDEQEWGNRKPEWHWHAYRRHMVRRREQACDLASGSRWRRVKKLDAAQAPARQFARDLRVCDRPCEETRYDSENSADAWRSRPSHPCCLTQRTDRANDH